MLLPWPQARPLNRPAQPPCLAVSHASSVICKTFRTCTNRAKGFPGPRCARRASRMLLRSKLCPGLVHVQRRLNHCPCNISICCKWQFSQDDESSVHCPCNTPTCLNARSARMLNPLRFPQCIALALPLQQSKSSLWQLSQGAEFAVYCPCNIPTCLDDQSARTLLLCCWPGLRAAAVYAAELASKQPP